jgi:23S rRNA-/tRNA-specific pseudouridylate synthase
LRHAGFPVVGDELYGGKPLWLSRLKPNYRLKPGHEERPLLSRAALHAEELTLPHPVTGEVLTITAPWPKDLKVALKYLRQFAA